MHINKPLLASSLLLSLTAVTAEASLTSYTSNDGVGLVYSSISDITWTQDASLLRTLENTLGYDNAIAAIIAARPVIYDTPNYYGNYTGHYTVTASDFYSGGEVDWYGAQAFVGYLNSVNYGGSTQWRLPASNSIYGDYGTAGNELGQLFYGELGGTDNSAIPNTNAFNNEQASGYWSGTENLNPANAAWFFDTSARGRYYDPKHRYADKHFHFYTWAVSPGQVAAVPLPGAVWLMGSGLLGLVGLKRRGHAL